MADPLLALADLPDVAEAIARARDAVDGVLWDRAIRGRAAEVARASRLRGGWASAALDGAEVRPDALVSGAALDGSPIGQVVGSALAIQAEVPRLVDVMARAPLQAVAALHTAATAGLDPSLIAADDRGRLRRGATADDPLHLGPLPDATTAAGRVAALAPIVTRSSAPALILASVVHAELAVTRPFTWGSGLVARASTRLLLAARGVDPDGLTAPEAGFWAAGRTAYAQALRAYATGTSDGVAQWIVLHADAIRVGADESRRIYADLPPA